MPSLVGAPTKLSVYHDKQELLIPSWARFIEIGQAFDNENKIWQFTLEEIVD